MAEPTIAAGYPKAFLDFAVSRGADCQRLIEQSGIRPDDLEDQDNRVPFMHYMALMEAGVELCKEPALALLFGEAVRLQDISIVGLIGEASETTEEARRQLNRYAHLMLDEDEARVLEYLELVREEGRVWLKLTSLFTSTTGFSSSLALRGASVVRGRCSGPPTISQDGLIQRRSTSLMKSRATVLNMTESSACRWSSAAR